jgi:hypothetical protein
MMEAYFDESGIHERAKVCVVAGFYGEQQSWRDFENRWNAVITDYPELEGEGFHAKRFYARNHGKRVGKYRNWTDERAESLLERLVVCITSSNVIFPIAYAALVDDFLALPLQSRQWLTGAKFNKKNGRVISGGCPNKPYYLPFTFCVLKSAEKSATAPGDKTNVFVGLDRTFHGYASSLYKFLLVDDRLSESVRSKLGTLTNPLAKDTPGIQAADLIAYTMYGASIVALANPKKYQPPAFLMRLLQNWNGEPSVRLMNREVFSAMEREGEAAYRRMLASGNSPVHSDGSADPVC